MVDFLREYWKFVRENKMYWILPIVGCLLLVGALIFFAQGSAVAPFVYTLF